MKTVQELLNATNTEIEAAALELLQKQALVMSEHKALKLDARAEWRRLAHKVRAIRDLRGEL